MIERHSVNKDVKTHVIYQVSEQINENVTGKRSRNFTTITKSPVPVEHEGQADSGDIENAHCGLVAHAQGGEAQVSQVQKQVGTQADQGEAEELPFDGHDI